MPRGAKGWPIDSDERPGWRDIVPVIAFIGVGAPVGFSLFIYFVPGAKGPPWWFMFALFDPLAFFLVVLLAVAGGRSKWTPTAVLWLPAFRRTTFVQFSDIKRMCAASKMYTFDDGRRRIKLPFVGRNVTRKRAVLREQRDRVGAWLDEHFAPLTHPARRDWRASVVYGLNYFIITPLATLLLFPLIVKTLVPMALRHVSPNMNNISRVLMGAGVMISFMAIIAAFPLTVFLVARYGFGISPPARTMWRLRRERWQGFEVEPLRPVASPPPSL